MASASTGDVGRHLRQLFGAGSSIGLTDGQLLDRYISACRRGEREAAFETILTRHGSTVLSVCRQVLGDGHAAEDAFQATFLVLVRRAASLRLREGGSLGAWLHGVAYRTSLKARKGAARRRAREHQVARPEARAGLAVAAVERDDLGSALHAEVTRLPAKYRDPVVLCYFEGRTHDEAAATLNWPVGTVRCRLSRARDLLRVRLFRRGLAPTVAALGAAWTGPSGRAEVPAPLVRATLDAAVRGVPTGATAAMAGLVLDGLFASRLRIAMAALGLVVIAGGLAFVLRGAPVSLSSEPRPFATVPIEAKEQPSPAVDRPGDPLPTHARARLGTSAFRHGDLANQALYSRDGKTLITLGWKRVVGIWDAATGRLLHQMALSGDLFERMALSPDGTTLATTEPNPDCRLRLWDVATGRERRRWHLTREYECASPEFSADGRTLITIGSQYDAATRQSRWFFELWDLTVASERRRRISGDWGRPQEFLASPDGKSLAAMGNRLVELQRAARNNGPPGMGPVAQDNEIRILDLATGRDRAVLWAEGVFYRSLAFSPDGRHLATSLTDGSVRVYEAATGHERLPRPGRGPSVGPPPPYDSKEYRAWLEVVDCLAFSPDGSIVAGGSSQAAMTPSPGSLYLWDFSRGRELCRIDGFRTGPGWLSFAPDGRTIASAGSWEPITRLWDVATGREAFPQPGHVMGISTLAVSPADGTVFTGSYDGTVRQWDSSTGRELGLVGRFNSVLTMAIAPDGKTLLVGGHFGDPALLSVAERREIRRIPGVHKEGTVHHVAYSRDGRTVAFQGQIWDAASGRPLPTLRAPDEPREGVAHGNLRYTPDGKRVITVDPEIIRTWDIASGAEVAPAIRGVAILSAHVALSADGRFLATSGYPRSEGMMQSPPDPWIHVMDLATGREVARLPAHEKSASGVALSPDGRLLASFRPNDPTNFRIVYEPQPQDPTIRVWDVATGRELRRLDGHRGIVNTVVFTPDGRSLISAGDDATALVWDVSDLQGK